MKHKLFTLFVLLTLLLVGMPVQPARAAGTTLYVDVDVHCSFDCGGSWATAYHDLQDALTAAVSGDQIWVAEGVYYPGAKGDRDATFTLKNGVKIYGGFDGTEGRLTDRDFSTNLTILSGDLDKNDVNTDGNFIAETTADIVGENAYHLVTNGGTDTNTVLDGFIITAGSADIADNSYGGGILSQSVAPLLKNLVISGNYALERGGGMLNSSGNPILENVTFTGNHANYGGGIYNESDGLVLTNIVFDSNAATDSGGGMYNTSGSPSLTGVTFSNNTAEFGGGLYNAGGGNPALSQVSFSGNIANYGGGMSNRYGSAPSLSDVTFTNNQATINGGGLENSVGNPTLTNVTFDGNHAGSAGGGMSNSSESNPILTHVSFRNNVADSYGGGMSNWTDATPLLEDVTFNDNEAGDSGGGMYNYAASPVIKNVTLSNNSANVGGGITNLDSASTLLYVTISHNDANFGGGMYNDIGSSPSLTNVTFSGNTGYNGGGIYNENSRPTLLYVTISGNTGTNTTGGMYNSADSHPILHGVLIANSTGGDCENEAGGSLDATSSHNLIEDSATACGLTNGVSGNIVGLDPQLGVLADNGGDTLTHALLVDSPAIDTGENSFCPAADQRGEARPNGLYCDIGAYESNEPHPYIVSITRADPNAVNAASVDFNITFSEPVDNVHDYDFQVTATGTISGAAVTNIAGDTTNGVVTVSTGTGSGTIRLDIPAGVGIVDADDNPLSGLPYTSGETYSVRPQTFNDVPMNYWAWNFIERLSLAGITGGCGGGNYCPEATVTRAQMAVFLLVAEHGTGYTPPAATGVFADVPASDPFANWIEQLAAEGITGGCGGGNYCPNQAVTREQMAVFLLVAEHGSGYTPPAATGIFNDVPADNGFAKWIEALAAEGITGGCGGGNFCPKTAVNRAQMAIFLVTAFDLP